MLILEEGRLAVPAGITYHFITFSENSVTTFFLSCSGNCLSTYGN